MATSTKSRKKRDWITFAEAAEEYCLSVTGIRRATKNKDHPLPYHVPTGQKRGFTLYRPELEQWLMECRVVGPQ